MRRLLLLTSVTMLVGCGASEPNYKVVNLPSGKQVKVVGVVKMHFSNSSPALMLKYQTDLSLDDKPALEKEVDEIWESFRTDVEKGQLTDAIVSANTKPTGFILKKSRGYNFVFKKSDKGQWSKLPSAGPGELFHR